MPSRQSIDRAVYLRGNVKPKIQSINDLFAAVDHDRRIHPNPEPPKKLNEEFNIETTSSRGYTVHKLAPKQANIQNTVRPKILYLHGGGFLFTITDGTWDVIAELARGLEATVTVPLYPLAPGPDLHAIYEAVQPLYNELAAAATPAEPFLCCGDSAGGTMAIVLARRAIDDGKPCASLMALLSPATGHNRTKDMEAADANDPWLSVASIEAMRLIVCPELDPKDSELSPIHGNLRGLPPMVIFAGGLDLLTPGTKKFAQKALEEGVHVELHNVPEMIHVWLTLQIPEAQEGIKQMLDFFKQQLSLRTS